MWREVNADLVRGLVTTPPEINAQRTFKLYDTYGFPPDLTALMAEERGISVDMAGFNDLMEAARQRSREAGIKRRLATQIIVERPGR